MDLRRLERTQRLAGAGKSGNYEVRSASREFLAPGGRLYLAEPSRPIARSAREHLLHEGLSLAERIDAAATAILGRESGAR